MGVAHLTLDLGAGHERRDGVDHEHVERARADQHLGDLERLLTVVRLGQEQVVDVDADAAGVARVHRMLGVDEGRQAALALGLGDHVVAERRLARGLGAEHLDHAAAGQPADAEGEVERQRTGRDDVDVDGRRIAHLHDRALAELLLDLAYRCIQSFVFFLHVITFLAALCAVTQGV